MIHFKTIFYENTLNYWNLSFIISKLVFSNFSASKGNMCNQVT
ncbi:hypothetical protein M153_15780001401 [Pseudoloma neurophilia]|uniref:Uncharacterized protein n=1 Tax=Pseudoloma neurophilia TaxID=146866 RepID=A0A0R0M0C9_9MICR|nr:hypothetical protein M153_15780001401 [Pseudoloma neurophilia]